MKILQITEANALKAYNSADKTGKEVLSNLFGKEIFTMEITDRVKTIDYLLQVFNIYDQDMLKLLNYAGVNNYIIGAKNLMLAELIAEVYNEGWVADYSNTNQKKWFPCFDLSNGGFALSGADCDLWYTSTDGGSRLAFKSEKLAIDAAKNFPEVYKNLLTKK